MIDCRGRTLTPCRRKVAEREVRLNRAKWIGPQRIRLRFDPFAYRYTRLKVLARDDCTCYWCGAPGFTIDHIIPWSKGGRTTMDNCICACQECNGERGDMSAEEFARLRNVPPPDPARLRRLTAKQLAAAREAALAWLQGAPVKGTGPAKPAKSKKQAKREPAHPADGPTRGKAGKVGVPVKQRPGLMPLPNQERPVRRCIHPIG